MRVDVTVDVSAPPEAVWAVLADVGSWPTWTASITSVRPLSPDLLQVGSRVRIMQPRLPATVWTVSDLVEGASTRTSRSASPAGCSGWADSSTWSRPTSGTASRQVTRSRTCRGRLVRGCLPGGSRWPRAC